MKEQNTTMTRIGDKLTISETEAYRYVYRSLSLRKKWKRYVDETYLREHTEECTLIYHPMWIAKVLVIADRPPFPPKKIPNMVFVDAVSGYRGVFSKIPPLQECKEMSADVVPMRIPDEDTAKKYVHDVQDKQINRSYILKKPRHEIRDIFPAYLPMWKIAVRNHVLNETFYINANTGELETHMQKRWQNGRDLLK